MPLDFAALAIRFAALIRQDRLAAAAARGLVAAVARRGTTVRAADLGSRELPVLAFEGAAPAVLVVPVAAEPDPASFGGFVAFGAQVETGWARWWSAAQGVPVLVAAADELLAAIDASITRYDRPRPADFDPGARTVLDLVGVTAALYGGLLRAGVPGGDLDLLAAAVVRAVAIASAEPPAPQTLSLAAAAGSIAGAGTVSGAGAGSAGAAPLGDEADEIVLAAGLLVVALPRLASILLAALDIRAQLLVLDLLELAERYVHRTLAGTYRALFAGLRSIGSWMLRLFRGVESLAGGMAHGLARFAVGFGTALGAAVRDFVAQLAHFLHVLVAWVRFVAGLLELIGLDRWLPPGPFDAPAVEPEAALEFHLTTPAWDGTLFGAEVRRDVASVLATTSTDVRAALTTGFTGIADRLAATAGDFGRLAATNTRLDARLALDYGDLTDTVLPLEPEPAQRDPLALALESWLVAGGVATLAAALDGYARHTAQRWHARYLVEPEPAGPGPGRPTPTSPHVLARRPLPRVAVPRVLVRVGGPVTDDVLDAVATEFAATVRSSYRAQIGR
ncbi:hypothetical protein [Nocardia goodfellowii]|uniref:Uncharacterized protein n=1 Tax=Nocardia goodfellowii TaxID=882446 RepID=A0ABS4QMP2_9NOCA|nr:hypothetical protein [Nocardia goodfellowii]MBP2192970.1 hypothetical protein [Nocardia goodfellowii]